MRTSRPFPTRPSQHFDSVCIGEGEGPWRAFLEDFEHGRTKPTYFGPMNVPLATLGTPRRDLIHANYQYPSVMTSRGCPHHCSFCYLTVFKQREYRTIPHDTILEDLDAVRDHFAVVVTDENFIGYTDRDVEDRKILLEKMIRRNYRFAWGCQASTKLATEPELMSLMHRAGCRAVFVGFESIDEEGLKLVGKNHNVGLDYREVIARLHEHKLAVIASTILGLDSHGRDYPDRLIAAMKAAKADFPRVFFATAWPGTPLFADAREGGAREPQLGPGPQGRAVDPVQELHPRGGHRRADEDPGRLLQRLLDQPHAVALDPARADADPDLSEDGGAQPHRRGAQAEPHLFRPGA